MFGSTGYDKVKSIKGALGQWIHPQTPWFGYDYGGCSLLLDARKRARA